jgi:hypothetical protein
MKHLRLFEDTSEYEADKGSFEFPTLSYTKKNGKVWDMKKPRPNGFIATYNVTSTTSTTKLLGSGFNKSQIKEMYIANNYATLLIYFSAGST